MTSKALALSLLRIVQSSEDRDSFSASQLLVEFVAESGIGINAGTKVRFSPHHKEQIRNWLRSDGIDPGTLPDAWHGHGRAQALDVGPDEKWAAGAIRSRRIALKTLPHQPLLLRGQSLVLPSGASLEWSVDEAVAQLAHEAVILVENWEAFERIDELELELARAGDNPLVLWRGGGGHTTTGAALDFLRAYRRPVWSAPDYDPAGLAIAERLPGLAGVLTPPVGRLQALLASSRLTERYQQQLPSALGTLESATNSDVRSLWQLIRASGKALPQEALCLPAQAKL